MSEGMTDALITELSKIQALSVASRASVMRFRGTDDSVPEIARALGVEALVGGSVVVVGDQIRVTAQLIDAATDQNLWAESFDRDFTNILALQSEIARAVAAEVRVTVTPGEAASLATTRPVNRQAYEAYLTGKYFMLRFPAGLPRAVEAFEQSIAAADGFAPAYAGLSFSYTVAAYYGGSLPLPPPQILPRAKDLAERALALDDSLAAAHLASGAVKMAYEWDWAAAKAAVELALALDPEETLTRAIYGLYLCFVEGRTQDAVAYARQTLEQDPLSPDLNTRLGMFLYYARAYDEAIEVLRRVLERDPTYTDAGTWLRHSLAHAGRMDEIEAMSPPGPLPSNLIGYVIAGRDEEARRIAQELLDQQVPFFLSGYGGGYLYSILGDTDRAFAALNDFETRTAFMSQIRTDPRLDLLRDDPRFDALLERMNFPGIGNAPQD